MHTTTISYSENLEAFAAYPSKERRPAVILCHAWRGRDEFICEKARAIADLGYVGFAIDMYGKGILGKSKEENAALKKPFMEDRQLLLSRMLEGFEVARSLPYVDSKKMAVLGYGFGGVCSLDLARSGADLKGAISVYGHFERPRNILKKPIHAKILVHHGYNDPIVKQEELLAFEKEMNEAKTDWQILLFGNTMHAFATRSANDPASGILYNPLSAERSWRNIQDFLKEIFS